MHLTFDDGPDPEWTPRVIDELERVGARATFFVIGERVARHPELVRQALEAGHRVELHCMRHLVHPFHWRATIDADTREALEVLAAVGVRPTYWRPPCGARSSWSDALAASHGLRPLRWSADGFDWRGGPREAMLARIAPDLGPGAVVVLHDAVGPGAPRPDCSGTVALIDPLVALARERGLEPALLGDGPSLGDFGPYSERAFRARSGAPPSADEPRHRAPPPPPVAAEVRIVEEGAISDRDRAALRALIDAGYGRKAGAYGPQGWRTMRPAFRSLGCVDGELVGQLSVFAIETDPPTLLYGLGDAIVAEAHRGVGIARAVVRLAFEECWRRGAEIQLADTEVLKRMMLSWGFESVPRFAFHYERDCACRWHQHWIAAFRGRLPPGRLRLAEGDF